MKLVSVRQGDNAAATAAEITSILTEQSVHIQSASPFAPQKVVAITEIVKRAHPRLTQRTMVDGDHFPRLVVCLGDCTEDHIGWTQ